MLNKRGMFLIDALLAMLIVALMVLMIQSALKIYLETREEKMEYDDSQEIYIQAKGIHDD